MTVASARVYAVTVHATWEYATSCPGLPNTTWNVGSATLTTVMSRIDMIAPRTTTPAMGRFHPTALIHRLRAASCTFPSGDNSPQAPK